MKKKNDGNDECHVINDKSERWLFPAKENELDDANEDGEEVWAGSNNLNFIGMSPDDH